MPTSTPDAVRRILNEFELRIRSVFESAWQDWLAVPNRASYSPRSRASLVFDFLRARGVAEFDGDKDVRVIPKGQTVQFLIRDKLLVRFKKANGAGLGSNIETQAVLLFVDPQRTLPGLLPDLLRVEICYHLDKLATKMEQIAVTARECNWKLWSYELAKAASAEIIPLPTGTAPYLAPPEVRIRKPKPKSEPGASE